MTPVVSLCCSMCIELLCGAHRTNTRPKRYSHLMLICCFSELPTSFCLSSLIDQNLNHSFLPVDKIVAKQLGVKKSSLILSFNLIAFFCHLSLKIL